MLSSLLPLLGVAVGLPYIIYYIVHPYFFSPYRHLPCAKQPFLLRRLFHDPTSFELIDFSKETPNHGLIRYFGFLNQERLLLTTPDACREILLRESYKFDKLPSVTALQAPAGVSGLVTAKGQFHKHQRRDTIAAYNINRSEAQYPVVWKVAKAAAQTLSARLSKASSNLIQVNKFMQDIALDTVGFAAFSVDFGAMAHPEKDLVRNYLDVFAAADMTPVYIKLMQLIPASWHPPSVKMVASLLGLDCSLIGDVVERSLKSKLQKVRDEEKAEKPNDKTAEENPPDILEGLVRRAHENLTEKYLLEHAMTILAGSTEMISNQLAWGIYALSDPRYQPVQDKLRSEIRKQFPRIPATVTLADVKKIPYLMGTANEIIRYYPSVADRGRVCNTDSVLVGQVIKKGTFLTWPVWALNRSTELWGDDADVFCPERWLSNEFDEEGEGARESKRDAYSFMTFGQGTRQCPGQHYTRVVMACMLLSLIGRYRFSMPKNMFDLFEKRGSDGVQIGIVMKAVIYAEVDEVPGWPDSDR